MSLFNPGDLGAFDEAEYGWLSVSHFRSGNPTLFIFSNEPTPPQLTSTGHGIIPISRDVPLDKQDVLTVDVVMAYTTIDKKGEKVLRRTLTIAPDPSSEVLHKIVAENETTGS